MDGNKLNCWVGGQLTKLLGFDASGDFTSYLLSMETKGDLVDYLQELLDCSNPKHDQFIQELLKKWKPKNRQVEQNIPEGITVYKKDAVDESAAYKATKTKNKKSKTTVSEKEISANVNQSAISSQQTQPQLEMQVNKAPVKSPQAPFKSSQTPVKSPQAHKTKFVPLFSAEGKDRTVVQIPGRHACVCQSHKHGLINNCLSCGRVVCSQEGSGPCVFCGTLVCTEEERESIARGSKKGDKLYESLMKGSAVPKFAPQSSEDAQAKKAKEHKNRLLHYDKTSARRTKVIDDESDYYASENKWLSVEEREALQKKRDAIHAIRHASRLDKSITFDFAGRRLVDSTFDTTQLEHAFNSQDNSFGEDITNIHKHITSTVTNPSYLSPSHKPQFLQSNTSTALPTTRSANAPVSKRAQLRLQDKGLQEVVDNGMCLSMHQPWASLLVAGIKVHEGRTWYSSHRGKLWIASTSQTPSDLEIKSLEQEYTQRLGAGLPFPQAYPVGCLLGSVDVVDVLAQEEYRQQFPHGESASPYVFICEHAQELPLKFPMKGQHKIYKLDSQMHKAARMGL